MVKSKAWIFTKIMGTDTLKYTVADDNGYKVNILIKNILHVPTMDVMLISLEKIAQQSDDKSAGGDVRGKIIVCKIE